MNEYLPEIKYKDGIRRSRQTGFGGLDRRAAAGDGSIRFMRNMTTDHYPLMGARARREAVKLSTAASLGTVNGTYALNDYFIHSVLYPGMCGISGCPHAADSTTHSHLYVNNNIVNDKTENPVVLRPDEKAIAHIGNYVCAWPDKVFLKFPEEEYSFALGINKIDGFKFTNERIDGQTTTEGAGDTNRFTRLDIYMSDADGGKEERNKLFKLNPGDEVNLLFNGTSITFHVKSAFQVYNYTGSDTLYPIGRIAVQEDFHELLDGFPTSKLNETDYFQVTAAATKFTIVRAAKSYTFGSLELSGRFSGVSYTSGVDENGMQGTLNRIKALMYANYDDVTKFTGLEPECDFKADDTIFISPQNLGGGPTDEYTSERSYILRKAEKTLVSVYGSSESSSNAKKLLRYDFYLDDYVLPKKTSKSRNQAALYGEGHGSPLYLVERRIPQLDGVFIHNNRLWGWKDDTIYCSGLGNPFNWYNYELSTGAWTVATGTPGRITAGCSYLGYPIFFKEDRLFKVYGEYPAQFRLSQVSIPGVREGGAKSLAICGRLLTYAGPDGIYQYSGSNSVNRISDVLGKYKEPWDIIKEDDSNADSHDDTFCFPFEVSNTTWEADTYFDGYFNIVAGSDGRKYYINLYLQTGFGSYSHTVDPQADTFLGYGFPMLCFDSYTGLWTVENRRCMITNSVVAGDLFLFYEEPAYTLDPSQSKVTYDDGIIADHYANASTTTCARMSYNLPLREGFMNFISARAADYEPESETDEVRVSEAVFNDFSNGMAEKKGVSRIDFVALGNGSVTPFISWDGGSWQKLRDAVNVEGKKCYISTVVPRRTGVFRLKFIGTGEWMISNLEIEYYNGTDLQEK